MSLSWATIIKTKLPEDQSYKIIRDKPFAQKNLLVMVTMDVNYNEKSEYCVVFYSFVRKSDDVPCQICSLLRSRETHTKDKAAMIQLTY